MKHSIYLSCILMLGIISLFACSSKNQSDTKNNTTSTNSSNNKIQVSKSDGLVKNSTIPLSGIGVYVDPDTGKFLDHIPPSNSNQENNINKNTLINNNTTKPKPQLIERQSDQPTGGQYIYIPDPWRTTDQNQ